METVVFKVDPVHPDANILQQAGELIRRGGLVGFPTETVYGLAANALDVDAVNRVYEVKGRPEGKPLPVQVGKEEDIYRLAVKVPELAVRLFNAFFPGPLTLVLTASQVLPDIVTAGTGKVGIRMPDHAVALGLIKAAGVPIVAPSANLSGQPPPTAAEDVIADFDGLIEMVLDAGPTKLQVASTVLDVTEDPPRFVRAGPLTDEIIKQFLGKM